MSDNVSSAGGLDISSQGTAAEPPSSPKSAPQLSFQYDGQSKETPTPPKANGSTNAATLERPKTGETAPVDKEVHFTSDAKEESHNHDGQPSQAEPSITVKKRSKKKSKSKRGKNAPTGFEEYYVDPPLTPAEFEVERDLYDPSNPFIVRIETAIQRYRARRNMNSDKKNLFDKWLTFGGVDSSPRQFTGGLDSQLLKESTAEQIAAFTAVNYVNDDMDYEGPGARYEVDFDGVVKSFLSSRLGKQFDCSTQEKVDGWCNIIRNFLNYLLHHDVCPEYKDQVYAARDSCTLAAQQIWACHGAVTSLPGDFSIACSTLFGGFYYDTYNEEAQVPPGSGRSMLGISNDLARQVFEFALAAHCDDTIFHQYQTQVSAEKVSMESLGQLGMEVTAIEMPSEDILYHYANLPGLEPTGILRTKSWKIPGTEATRDLTPEERLAAQHEKEVVNYYEFWVEEKVLKTMFLGMKFIAEVRKMSFGILYMDNCLGAFCSFLEVLPNELMLKHRAFKYTEPRPKEVAYDEDLDDYQSEPAAQVDGDDDQETEGPDEEHEQSNGEKLNGNAKAFEKGEDSNITGEAETHDETNNGKEAVSDPEQSRQKWHYEEINGELCFVPYEDPISDNESSVDDDDKVDALVNNRTGKTAYNWRDEPWYTGEPSSSKVEYHCLNPDTDPDTMELDPWARKGSPEASSHHENGSTSEDDDDKPGPGEHVLQSEMAASMLAPDLAAIPTDPKTPTKVPLDTSGAGGPTDSEDDVDTVADEDIDISPQTAKQSAEVPLMSKITNLKDDLTEWGEEMMGRLTRSGTGNLEVDEKMAMGKGTDGVAEKDGVLEKNGEGVVKEDGKEGLKREMRDDDADAVVERLTPFLQKVKIEEREEGDD